MKHSQTKAPQDIYATPKRHPKFLEQNITKITALYLQKAVLF